MTKLLEHVEKSSRARALFRRGERILVAVSGGVDSMVLLDLLHRLTPQHGWRLIVAHFNHRLRGRSSDADARFVEQAAKKLGLPVVIKSGEVKALARKRRLSIEMAARELRHKFFARTAKRLKICTVALAHHADDQVELFFLRLLRGAGGEGMSGMKWRNNSSADPKLFLVRPLLDVGKAELESFAGKNKISFRTDATNASRDILRNRVRHELLPLLRRRYQPSLNRTVLRLMELAGDEAEFTDTTATRWLAEPRPAFRRLVVSVQRQVLRRQLHRLGIESDFELVETLRHSSGKLVMVRPQINVVRNESGRVSIQPIPSNSFKSAQLAVLLGGKSGAVKFGGVQFRWQVAMKRGKQLPLAERGREVFDADKVGRKIVLRHWRAGDRFQPIGMRSPVKLQDWFTNRKISRERRRELVLATTRAGEVFWVEGERIGELAKVTSQTSRQLVWHWERD